MYIISTLAQFIPVVIGLFYIKSVWGNMKQSRYVFIYCLGGAVVEIIIRLSFLFNEYHYFSVYHFYTLFEFLILMFIFYKGISFPVVKKISLILLFIYPVVWIVFKIFIENVNSFDNYSSSLSSTLIAIFSFNLLVRLITKNGSPVLENASFWFLFSVSVYHCLNCSNFLFVGLVDSDQSQIIWSIHSVLNIVSQILFGIYFIKINKHVSQDKLKLTTAFKDPKESAARRFKYIPIGNY